MKLTRTETVYQDQETGVTYTREHTLLPVAMLSDAGEPARFGVFLRTYGWHPDIEWDDRTEYDQSQEMLDKYGFLPNRHGQDLFVTEELFQRRFKCLGEMSKEMDLEALTRQYEEEHCSFADKEHLAQRVMRQLSEMGPGLRSCELYAVLKGFMASNKNSA